MSIPKIVMQTWKTRDVPEKWRASPEAILRLMPDWDYVLMTDEDNRRFVAHHFPDFLATYDDFPYNIQRADAIRYMWLYVHGGLYVDLDILITGRLDDLFVANADLYLVSSGNIGAFITNSFLAARPRCPLWLEVIEEMRRPLPWYAIGRHFTVMMSTGPMMLDRVVKRSGQSYVALPSRLLMPCSVCDSRCRPTGALAVPLEGGSWNDWTSHVANVALCQWRLIVLGLIVATIVLVVVGRYRGRSPS